MTLHLGDAHDWLGPGGHPPERIHPRLGEPTSLRSRVSIRPGFWQRLWEAFVPPPPRPLMVGFTFGSSGPDGLVELRSVEVSTVAPSGVDAIDLDFEVYVNGQQRIEFYPHSAFAAVGERGAGGAGGPGGSPASR